MAENMTAGAANEAMVTETIHVTEARIACDGGGGPLGHPRVWLTLGTDGEVVCPNQIIAKVSRVEVAQKFFSPAPDKILKQLLDMGKITQLEAELAKEVPVAHDLTAEADSGGHTDNRSVVVLLPTMLALRDSFFEKYQYTRRLCVGLAGGIATPVSAAAAFAMGEKGSPSNTQALLALRRRSVSRCCRGSSRSPDSVKGATSDPSGRFPAAMATQGCNSRSFPPPMTPAPTMPTRVWALVLSKASSIIVSKYLSKGNPTVTMARSGAGAVPRSRASNVRASSTPFFQSLELLLIVVLNDGASAVAAAITARKRILPLDVLTAALAAV